MRRLVPLLSALTVMWVGSATAQTADDLTIEVAGAENVGIDNCATAIEDTFAVTGELADTNASEYELRLTWSTTLSACSREAVGDCTESVENGDELCGCLIQTDGSLNVAANERKLSDFYPDACDLSPGSTRRVYFFVEYFTDEGDESSREVSEGTSEQSILIDFERPSTPAEAPSISPVENALEITFAELGDSDIKEYEVCVREALSSNGDEDDEPAMGADALRDGFAASDCKTTSSTNYRFEGLTNGVNYTVVYAGLDVADNRGPNSPTASGTPAEVEDFAERYTSAGGTELGGCAASGSGTAGAFGLLLLIALRRRRAA